MDQAERKMLLSCNNLSLGYDGKIVVQDINLKIFSGDYLWVMGENGSGKSTFILGLLKLLNPLHGSITFCDDLANGRIGYLSQQGVLKKDFPAGVKEIVLSGNLNNMGLRPFYNSTEKKRAEDAMKFLDIMDIGKKCFRELSGGQQRRVLLARAFCAAGELLVLDEPASGLDPLISQELYELLLNLNRQTGITIIMVSHDTRGAEHYARHILYMEKGRGLFCSSKDYMDSDIGKKFFANKGADHV